MRQYSKCPSAKKCFGQTFDKRCRVLTVVYSDGECPFQKEEQFVTKGKLYPYNAAYGGYGDDKE